MAVVFSNPKTPMGSSWISQSFEFGEVSIKQGLNAAVFSSNFVSVGVSHANQSGGVAFSQRELLNNNAFIEPVADQNLGVISSNVVIPVKIWNSSWHAVNLTSIHITGTDGTTIDNPNAKHFVSNSFANRTITVSADGSNPFIDNVVNFDFANIKDFSFKITGTRIALFAFQPDFSEAATITFEFNTNILKTQGAKEQRIALRTKPAMSHGFMFTTLTQAQSARMSAFLMSNHGKKFALPIWTDAETIESVAINQNTFSITPEFADWSNVSLFALIDKDNKFELFTIASQTSDTITSTKATTRAHSRCQLVPVKLVKLSNDSTSMEELTSMNLRVKLEFDADVV